MMKKLLAGSIFALIIITMLTITAFAQVQKVPVVILFKDKPKDEHVNLVKSNDGEITRTYNIINGFAANLPEDKVENLKRNPLVISVDQDVEVRATDINADTQIRANQVWAVGDIGQAVPVAILDTGIDNTHPEFSARILKCHNEIFLNPNTCKDNNGHGTHVAGIAGAAGVDINAKGVAPAVSLYIDQVLNSAGSGTLSGIIAGIDWSVANGAKVISMSLGTDPISTTEPNCDTAFPSFTSAVNNAVAAGVTVVAASGNEGTLGVDAPGCISSTIAVGAVDSTDTIASFSSQGGPMADHGIVAPGVNIFSSWKNGGYNTISGTSMATPHVSGTIALMLQTNPALTPATIKSTLFNTACTGLTNPSCPTVAVPNTSYGHGRVDAFAAYSAVAPPPTCGLTFVSGAPINYGSLSPDDTSTEQTLVLDNTGTVTGTLVINGSNWKDSGGASHILVNFTKFLGASTTPYTSKISLNSAPTVVGTIVPAPNNSTSWQLKAHLFNLPFSGSLTQTMDFALTC